MKISSVLQIALIGFVITTSVLFNRPKGLNNTYSATVTDMPLLFLHGISLDNSPENCNSDLFWNKTKLFLQNPHSVPGYTGLAWAKNRLITLGYYSFDQCDDSILGSIELQSCGTAGTIDDNTPIATLSCIFAWYVYAHYSQPIYQQTGKCGGQPIAVIAHSMGGLIVRGALALSALKTLNEGKSWTLPPCPLPIKKVVTISTPYGGIPSFSNFDLALSDLTITFLQNTEMCIFNCNVREESDLGVNSSFIQALQSHAQFPQGNYGTEWTMIGDDCLPDPFNPSSVEMEQGIKVIFHQPCYLHSRSASFSIQGFPLSYLDDDSTLLDGQAWRCNNCVATPSVAQWGQIQTGQPHVIYYVLYSLVDATPIDTHLATSNGLCPILGVGRGANMPSLNGPLPNPPSGQISPNHQWVISVESTGGDTSHASYLLLYDNSGRLQSALYYGAPQTMLKLIRVDGQYQQIIFCSFLLQSVAWDSDQKGVTLQFSSGDNQHLDLGTGSIFKSSDYTSTPITSITPTPIPTLISTPLPTVTLLPTITPSPANAPQKPSTGLSVWLLIIIILIATLILAGVLFIVLRFVIPYFKH